MSIEFHCENCGKFLKTSDDKAGRRGTCPECRAPIVVPAPAGSFQEESSSWHGIESADDYEQRDPGEHRYASRKRSSTCPMCGAENGPSAAQCSHCGEELQPGHDRTRRGEDGNVLIFSQIFDQTVSRFESNIGLCIGGVLLGFIMMFFAVVFLQMFLVIVGTGLIALLRNPGDLGAVILAIFFLGILAIVLLNCWLILGLNRFLLSLARFGRASIADLFSASLSMLGRMILTTLLFGLLAGGVMLGTMIFIGVAAANSPILILLSVLIGFILYLMLMLTQWCYPYVIVDQNPPGLGALTTTFRLMSGNYLTMFLILLCVGILNFFGAMMFGLGLLFTLPFGMLMLAVAYDQMTHSDAG
ncbi:MAG TPA: hypothetical protein VMM56_06365 [Planctomycetaceae bacterium]|nr:hypothetical protein [Planctomycetaceae bacterium]